MVLQAFISVLGISLISLIGVVTLTLNKKLVSKFTFILISLAAGVLIGDVFIHIIPESLETLSETNFALMVIAGILVFFVFENLLHAHNHHEHHDHAESGKGKKIVGWQNLLADSIHNFVDGVIIGAAYLAGPEIGIITTIAVALHEIPQEIGDLGILLHAGFSRGQAILFNFLTALSALLGLGVAVIFGTSEEIIALALSFTAGGFLYIAMSDIIPELRENNSKVTQIICLIIGVVVSLGLIFLE